MDRYRDWFSRMGRHIGDAYRRVREYLSARLNERGRSFRIALSVAFIVIMVGASFSVFRLTYGRPWFSAPASFEQLTLDEEEDADYEPVDYALDVDRDLDLEDPLTATEEPDDSEQPAGPQPGELSWPVGGESDVVVTYGLVDCPTLKRPLYHPGIDIEAPEGAKIKAPYPGVVQEVAEDLKMGWRLTLDHGGGVSTLYAAMDQVLVEPGQEVEAGEVIALVGNTALAEVALGPHLHFEVRIDDRPANPLSWLEP